MPTGRAPAEFMILLRFVGLLLVSCLLGAAQQSSAIPAKNPAAIAGRWETATSTGIEGIGFETYTAKLGDDSGRIGWQNVNVRVYVRDDGKERWGYFVAKEIAAPDAMPVSIAPPPTQFDGHRLQIHFTDTTDITPFDLDIMFSSDESKWVGTWSRARKREEVVLTRPQVSPATKPSLLVGKWIGEPDPIWAPTTLNIRQSSDGVFSAWLDRTLASTDRRNGEQLNVESMTSTTVILSTSSSPTGPTRYFHGSISADGQCLAGTWESPSGGGTLNAASQFRKAPVSSTQ
jgi:hypothetical protein